VQSEASPFMYHLYKSGSQESIKELPSLADGLSGEVEPASITIPIVRQLVDDILLVTEEEIKGAIHYAWKKHHQMIEGSAAVALAAALYNHTPNRPLILIMSGGNIQPKIHQQIIEEY
ncbi:MAG: pyridoxal-phosphate dependent enzyme, partial [Anaerolineales bacterium]